MGAGLAEKEPTMKTTTLTLIGAKQVYVRAYTRFRHGKLEYVIQHFRSWPR